MQQESQYEELTSDQKEYWIPQSRSQSWRELDQEPHVYEGPRDFNREQVTLLTRMTSLATLQQGRAHHQRWDLVWPFDPKKLMKA